MGLQPMGKVRGLLAALVAAPAVDLPRAQVATAAAEIPPPPGGPAGLPQAITFGQPSDTTVGRPVTLSASSVTTTTPSRGTGLLVSFRSDTPHVCTVSVQNTGTGATHTVRIESSPGARLTTIKEARL
jgi:hypothetical protein